MDAIELEQRLHFLRAAEQLKNTLRSGFTSQGRPESSAEHTWRLCLLAMVFEDQLRDLDFAKLLKICILHDLGEAISGDIPAIHQHDIPNKNAQERLDFQELLRPLHSSLRTELLALWDEYDQAQSPEAKAAKALDKLETVLQHTQGLNPPDFDYAFNLSYGQQYTAYHPLFSALRAIIDRDTQTRHEQQAMTPSKLQPD